MKGKDQDTKSNGHLHKLVDGSAKIIAAGAIVAAAIIANNFQSKMSTISLLSNRELAESQLRGEMFANLISPIIGSRDENNKYDPRREQLLVELLALNFHEHFFQTITFCSHNSQINCQLCSIIHYQQAISSLMY